MSYTKNINVMMCLSQKEFLLAICNLCVISSISVKKDFWFGQIIRLLRQCAVEKNGHFDGPCPSSKETGTKYSFLTSCKGLRSIGSVENMYTSYLEWCHNLPELSLISTTGKIHSKPTSNHHTEERFHRIKNFLPIC